MEQRLNKLVPIIGIAIVSETLIFILHLWIRELFWYIFLSYVITYTLMLFFANRAGVFNQIGFLLALLYTLLISAPLILLPPVIGLFGWCSIYVGWSGMDWLYVSKGLAGFSLIKFVFSSIIAFVFCILLKGSLGLSDKEELGLYGTTAQGAIYRTWQHRHLRFVRAEYHINGKRYETDSKPDHNHILSENDKVTIIYSTRYPLVSIIKELEDHFVTL
jgi:hypothetical protein